MNKKATILYVDREVNNINSFVAIFRRDYKILTASSATEGFDILLNDTVHIVISDLYVEETDGLKFLLAVSRKYCKCTCILISDYPLNNAVSGSGIYKKLTKPWDETEFRIILKSAYDLFLLKENVLNAFW
ncbi:response regulator [Dyadobacter sp. LHD-138]|uniref:response regulator n=1 Tax=Dyadobacter sp. LHD-138 TaxID=3071413 RepID=UPI0027DF08DF|nr:response regulator [Dyadobacter sp. LHD-138]MDQ6481900.1 response regulator [Dyadobacter sp. LHD-138]